MLCAAVRGPQGAQTPWSFPSLSLSLHLSRSLSPFEVAPFILGRRLQAFLITYSLPKGFAASFFLLFVGVSPQILPCKTAIRILERFLQFLGFFLVSPLFPLFIFVCVLSLSLLTLGPQNGFPSINLHWSHTRLPRLITLTTIVRDGPCTCSKHKRAVNQFWFGIWHQSIIIWVSNILSALLLRWLDESQCQFMKFSRSSYQRHCFLRTGTGW